VRQPTRLPRPPHRALPLQPLDHRVVDGIDAARFIQAVHGYLELPATMFVA
jgi:pyruvate/2-oxoglutarate dehydrogenase complex dihydrolipoamide acyltransferase (E2) component